MAKKKTPEWARGEDTRQIEKHGDIFRVTFSFGKDQVSGGYRKVRVYPFDTLPDARVAREQLNRALQVGDKHMDPGVDCFKKVCEENGWKRSGRMPGGDPTVVSVRDLAFGFLEYRSTNGWGGYGPMVYRSRYSQTKLLERHLGTFGDRDVKRVARDDMKDFARKLSTGPARASPRRC